MAAEADARGERSQDRAGIIDRWRGRPLDDGQVLYQTPSTRYLTLTMGAFAVIAVLELLLVILLMVLTAQALSEGAAASLFAPLLAVMWALVAVLLVLTPISILATLRSVFAVTTKGITATPGFGRPRHVPWDRVAELRTVNGGVLAGAVEVVTTDRERIAAKGTNTAARLSQAPLPPSKSRLAHDARGATAPHLVAHDALERFRRGEFEDPEAIRH